MFVHRPLYILLPLLVEIEAVVWYVRQIPYFRRYQLEVCEEYGMFVRP